MVKHPPVGAARSSGSSERGRRPNSLDIFTPIPGVVGSISGNAGHRVKVTVHTNGDAALPAGATVSLYASPDGTLTGATLIGTATLPAGLGAQASATVSIST